MSAMASQFSGVSIVCSAVCSGTDQRKHQSSASLPFVRGTALCEVDSSHKGPVTRKMFPFDDVIMRISHVDKNIERHTAHTISPRPNPKQWVIAHISDLMMIIRQSKYILSIITWEMGKLKTHSPTYCIKDNWENLLNLTHTLDKIYLTGTL